MWDLLDKLKDKNSDSLLYIILKLLYLIGKTEWLNSLIMIIVSIFIPIAYDDNMPLFVGLIIGVIVYFAFTQICISYKKHSEYRSSRLFRALDLHSETLSSVACQVESSEDWQSHFFEPTAQIVCSKIHDFFYNELKINTRVAVEYVFETQEANDVVKNIKMVGRQSQKRQNASRVKKLCEKSIYYIYRVFENNNVGINTLSEHQIKDKTIWYRNEKHDSDVKEYWGIAVANKNDEVAFVLEIDFLKVTKISEKDRQKFISDYMRMFIQTLRLSFLQDGNINH